MTSYTVGAYVTAIGDYAFYGCDGIAELHVLPQTPPTIASDYTFYDVNKNIPVYVPVGTVQAYQNAQYWSDFFGITIPTPVLTNLSAQFVSPTQVQLSWTNGAGSTTANGYFADNNGFNPIMQQFVFTADGDQQTALLTLDSPLQPATTYYIKMWNMYGTTVGPDSDVLQFTTPAACAAPTGLAATNIGPFSATLNWTGNAVGYEVEYREKTGEVLTTAFEERFNSISTGSLPNGWIVLNSGTANAQWQVINQGNNNNPFANGGKYGSIASAKASSANANTYFLMPVDDLSGVLTFYAKYQNTTGTGARRLAVYYTNETLNPTANDLTLVERINLTTTFTEYTVDLSAYQGGGYIAVEHAYSISNQAYAICVDDIEFQNYSYTYGAWIPAGTTTANTMTITGLASGGTYQARVSAVCPTGFMSDWATSANFTTPTNIVFQDNNVKALCLQNWNTNNDSQLSYAEAAAVRRRARLGGLHQRQPLLGHRQPRFHRRRNGQHLLRLAQQLQRHHQDQHERIGFGLQEHRCPCHGDRHRCFRLAKASKPTRATPLGASSTT